MKRREFLQKTAISIGAISTVGLVSTSTGETLPLEWRIGAPVTAEPGSLLWTVDLTKHVRNADRSWSLYVVGPPIKYDYGYYIYKPTFEFSDPSVEIHGPYALDSWENGKWEPIAHEERKNKHCWCSHCNEWWDIYVREILATSPVSRVAQRSFGTSLSQLVKDI